LVRVPGGKPWATCPITQSGFIRVSSNPGIVDPAVSPAEARGVLRQLTGLQQHQFRADDLDFIGDDLPFDFVMGHRQVTDAYLLGLTIARDGRLVTLDRGVPGLLAVASPHRQRIVLLTG
jgi:predicted nucleic acid-binding protein